MPPDRCLPTSRVISAILNWRRNSSSRAIALSISITIGVSTALRPRRWLMLVRHDEKVPIARLLTFLEQGERLANQCAQAQAAMVQDLRSRHFLLGQARQEAAHAWIFQGAIAWLAPRHLGDAPFLPALEEYRNLLDQALARQDLLETFLAEQVILEGLGEAILMRIKKGLIKRAAPFVRLQKWFPHQDEAYLASGRPIKFSSPNPSRIT